MSKLKEYIKEIVSTKSGQERNMYPAIKGIFQTLGHKSKNIVVDSASELGRGIPDLVIKAPVGVGEKGRAILGDWAVCEVKDEKDAFKTPGKRNKILREKEKYITLDTAYFIMIDPVRMVIRPVISGSPSVFDHGKDIVIEWNEALKKDDAWFLERASCIASSNSTIYQALQNFREGDTSSIAVISLIPSNSHATEAKRAQKAKEDFYNTIKRSTLLLQSATREALNDAKKDIEHIQSVVDDFRNKYGGIKEISLEPFKIEGKKVGPENAFEHDMDAEDVKEKIMSNPSMAKLALIWLPDFQKRFESISDTILLELFAIETANMILARILLLRFFEDHGFFGEKRYLCNGGIKAFQQMREYFELSYMKLLKDVYEKAKTIYYSVFEEMELDWALGSDNERLSQAVELSLMYFSRFDFATIKGDILTGIYDRFLEGSQRKKLGEYYTKPSVARYIIDRIDIKKGDTILDPACGSGTFLLEVFNKTVGDHIDSGLVTYEDAVEELEHIRGNDINPFSSMITQIQLLWHLLAFKNEILANGFPRLYVAEKHDSLIPQDIFGSDHSMYARIDKKDYDAVIGNPPYVRPERIDTKYPKSVVKYYAKDIKVEKNLFTLFIYRALDSWCKKGGYLGFVIPLSFCDNKSNANLRKLFLPGSRWKIVEIVDMEAISEYVFDASVQPIIFIAKNEPACEQDKICIKRAGIESLLPSGKIDLRRAPYEDLSYMDVWSEDGRVLTKLDSKRKEIIDKLLRFRTFEDIAFRYYLLIEKKSRKIVDYGLHYSFFEDFDDKKYKIDERIAITRGAVFRGKKPKITNGYRIYKGENVAAGMIEGEPAETDIDINNIDDPSLWKYVDILPENGFAFLRITAGVTASKFNPKEIAFLDTASLFFPVHELQDFPFDLLVLSNIYQFFYGVYARMGAVEEFYSNLYPTNLKYFPWSDALYGFKDEIESLREEYYNACRAYYNRKEALLQALMNIGAIPFKDLCLSLGAGKNSWGVEWNNIDNDKGATVYAPKPKYPQKHGDNYRINVSDNLFETIDVGNEFAAKALGITLTAFHDTVLKRDDFLNMPVPKGEHELDLFTQAIEEYDHKDGAQQIERIVYKIDEIVGMCFELTDEEIAYIQNEMQNDPFLKHIKPKYPFSGKKKRGLFKSLASSDRYK